METGRKASRVRACATRRAAQILQHTYSAAGVSGDGRQAKRTHMYITNALCSRLVAVCLHT
eukprot:3735234-Heterocapsa_arctica.AAC.1